MNAPTRIWSCGGGTQSAAIAALIVRGEVNADLAVIADTGMEMATTWAYCDTVIAPALAAVGLTLERIGQEWATVGLYSKGGKMLMPAYQPDGKGGVAKLPTYCSNEWKRRVVLRWIRSKGVERGALLLGISLDEAHRAKDSDVAWLEHEYPLLDLLMRRDDCLRLVADMGWPKPPRSRCWCCPHQGKAEWAEVMDGEHRQQAVAIDEQIAEGGYRLRRDLKPLAEAQESDDQLDLCDGGFCYV